MSDEMRELVNITGGPLKPHEYILVKADMNAGDDRWIQNHAAKSNGQGKDASIQLTIGDVRMATAKRMVVGWNLTREVLNPVTGERNTVQVAFSPDAIEELPGRIYRFLLKKIDELNPDDEDDDDFLTGAGNSSGDSSDEAKAHLKKH